MPSLLERLIDGNGEHKIATDSMMLQGSAMIKDISAKEYSSDLMLMLYATDEPSVWDSAEMDVQAEDSDIPNRLPQTDLLLMVNPSSTYTPARLELEYDPSSFSRWNNEVGLQVDSDIMELQWDTLVGNIEEFGANRLKLSANISLIVEQGGDSGGLDPEDPEPEEPEPVDPDDPDIIVIGGGINEVTLQINPNSYYTLGIGLADGVSLNGVTGLDNSMKWDGYKQTLSGWVLGSTPKEVTVMLGTDTAKLSVAATPVSRHVI